MWPVRRKEEVAAAFPTPCVCTGLTLPQTHRLGPFPVPASHLEGHSWVTMWTLSSWLCVLNSSALRQGVSACSLNKYLVPEWYSTAYKVHLNEGLTMEPRLLESIIFLPQLSHMLELQVCVPKPYVPKIFLFQRSFCFPMQVRLMSVRMSQNFLRVSISRWLRGS